MRYRELNYLFHRSIIVVSRSGSDPPALRTDRRPTEDLPPTYVLRQGRGAKSFGEHLQILAAIEEADVEKAQQRLEKHDIDGMRRAIASSLLGATCRGTDNGMIRTMLPYSLLR